jgi:fatty acid desaturase
MSTGRDSTPFLRTPAGVALLVFLAVAALLLLLEHQAHVLGAWPLLLLLLCAGMHFFMHRGHGHGGHGGEDR